MRNAISTLIPNLDIRNMQLSAVLSSTPEQLVIRLLLAGEHLQNPAALLAAAQKFKGCRQLC